jgi:ABC-2 type transport system ATP-binding protein
MITIENLSFGYRKRFPLFEGLDMEIPGGSIYGLLGKNGAGKSSLLCVIQGLLFPRRGKVAVMGHEPGRRRPDFLSDCFLVPEVPYYPNLGIAAFERLYAPFYTKFDRRLWRDLLAEFEVDGKGHLRRLSQGQQKKVMLAFALATRARVLLLDEPTNGLDIPSKKQFRSILARSISDESLFVLSTHQVRDLQSLIDAVIVLERGKVIFHEALSGLESRLRFGVQHREPEGGEALYWERVPGGYHYISPSEGSESLEVDIELLFNAVLARPAAFRELFKSPQHV